MVYITIDNNKTKLKVHPLWYGMISIRWIVKAHAGAHLVPLTCQGNPIVCGKKTKSNNNATTRFCRHGIVNKSVCCANACGHCGGSRCSNLPGGARQCCPKTIQRSHHFCQTQDETGCIIPYKSTIRVKSWAVQYTNGNIKVVIINKRDDITARVRLQVPSNYSKHGQLLELKARNDTTTQPLLAKHGVSLGGWTWDGSDDGVVQGKLVYTTIHSQQQNHSQQLTNIFAFDVHPASAIVFSLILHSS